MTKMTKNKLNLTFDYWQAANLNAAVHYARVCLKCKKHLDIFDVSMLKECNRIFSLTKRWFKKNIKKAIKED